MAYKRNLLWIAWLIAFGTVGCENEISGPRAPDEGLVVTSARLPGAEHGGRPLFATMTGPQEVPPGDPDGTGTARFTLNQGQGEICYEVTVSNIELPGTASHIHVGAAGVGAGLPVVFLAPPGETGSASGCVAVDPALIKAIRQNPSGYYVNVHNELHPAGAVRGQLEE